MIKYYCLSVLLKVNLLVLNVIIKCATQLPLAIDAHTIAFVHDNFISKIKVAIRKHQRMQIEREENTY